MEYFSSDIDLQRNISIIWYGLRMEQLLSARDKQCNNFNIVLHDNGILD